ncbi:MAG: hypothetical protein ABL921_24855 [Pirellula sp.]
MPRLDLMELTADDLASLTNRGTVKRAQKEVESNDVVVEFEEGPDDRVLAKWSDGFVCEFLHGKSIHDAKCSSGVLGISRHVIRSVLAYQRLHAGGVVDVPNSDPLTAEQRVAPECDPEPLQPIDSAPDAGPADSVLVRETEKAFEKNAESETTWDPGEITDEQLTAQFGKAQLQRAQARFDLGILIELTRGRKPFAVFLDERCFVRFMVPHDLQYATADCSESALARFVCMTVWAFRRLPKEKRSGILSLSLREMQVPSDLLDKLDASLVELASFGIANLAQSSVNRWLRLESELRTGELTWPAELVSELIHQIEMYQQHDALFDPESIVLRVGELVARSRAIRSNTREVPQLLIRGTKFDTAREIASSKYVGIGTEVKAGRKQTIVSVYLQDADTGLLATIERVFVNETKTETTPPVVTAAKPFEALASTPIFRGVRLSGLASSRVMLKLGKRTPSGELILPRSAMAVGVNPQLFRWETLKPPLLADSFSELIDRIASMPPSYLRPRHLTDAVHVIPIQAIEDVVFDPVRQSLTARVTDSLGGCATMYLPYESRNDSGFKAFAEALTNQSARPKFAAGRFRLSNEELLFLPMQIVLEDSAQRYGLSPYVSQKAAIDQPMKPAAEDVATENEGTATNEQERLDDSGPISVFLGELNEYLAEVVLMGIQNNAGTLRRKGSELAEHATRTGFLRIASRLQSLTDEFQSMQDSRDRSPDLAARLVSELAMIARVASR